MTVEGVRNGATEEDWCWDLNPGAAAMGRGGPCSLDRSYDHVAWGAPFATWLRKQERLCLEEKGRKDSCWWVMRRCHNLWINWRSWW